MNGSIKIFKDLDAWKEGHKLVLLIYGITKYFPKEEVYTLVSQMRRCAISITSNIAEGFSRISYQDKIRFYSMALGSLTELQNQSIIAKDIGYVNLQEFDTIDNQSLKVHKILNGLIKMSRVIHNS
jgi:four helix bundle protein